MSTSGLNVVRPPAIASIRTTYTRANVPWLNGNNQLRSVRIQDFEIKNKHLQGTTARRSRQFNLDNPQDANRIVQDALQNGKIHQIANNGVGSQSQRSFSAIIDTGKVIGTRGETFVKIVYDKLGNVWTVYPVPTP